MRIIDENFIKKIKEIDKRHQQTVRNLYICFGEIFISLEKKSLDGYTIIKMTVPCKLLAMLHSKLVLEGFTTSIGDLPEADKWKYYNISKRFYTKKEDCIRASKAAYIIDLITSK